MTTIKRYEGSDHIFNNQNGDTCTIKAKTGQTLNVEANIILDELKVNKVYYEDTPPLTTLKQNQIIHAPLNAVAGRQGYKVAISDIVGGIITEFVTLRSNPSLYLSEPRCGAFQSSSPGASFFADGSYINTTTATSRNGWQKAESLDINEEGSRMIFADGYQDAFFVPNSWITVRDRDGGAWTNRQYFTGLNARITGPIHDCYSIVSTEFGQVRIMYENDGTSTFGMQEILQPIVPGLTTANILVEIDGSLCCFIYGGFLKIYTRSGITWTNTQNYPIPGGGTITTLSLKNNVISMTTTTQLIILELTSGQVVRTSMFNLSGTIAACTNGTYVFHIDSTYISVYYKKNNVFTRLTYRQVFLNGTSICCNSGYLVVGHSSSTINQSYHNVYNIQAILDPVEYTSVVLNDNNLNLNSTYGSVAVNNVLYAPIVVADEMQCENNLTMYGYIKGKSDPSRFGYFKKNTSTTTTSARPVIFDAVVSEVSGLTYSYSGDNPNYNGSWTNTSGETIILQVSYSFRFTAATNEIASFIAVDQPLDGSGVCTFTKVCLASQVIPAAYSGAYRTTTGSAVISLSPNSYFAAFYANGSLGDTLVYQTCTITMARLL